MKQICDYYGRSHRVLETAEHVPADPAALNSVLSDDPEVTHVAAVHCETTSGILNPIGEIAKVVAGQRRSLIIDAMSTFGAIDIDADEVPFEALVASANKCLEGLPGLGFAIVRREKLEKSKDNAPSLSLDLYAQWQGLEDNGQWRFTPPTHVIAALDHALTELEEEGGVAARGARYGQNCRLLLDGLKDMGFVSALDEDVQAPIILTWLNPADPRFDFQVFYEGLSRRGFLIYPGKLTLAETFRIGCIGRLGETEMRATLDAVRSTIEEMGVTDCSPKVR
jgi:2-aminoethylphosphonate-pyruvate transaminase